MLGRKSASPACLAILLFVAALSGCADRDATGSESAIVDTAVSPDGMPASDPKVTPPSTGRPDGRAVPLDAVWHESPSGGIGAICSPTQTGVCEYQFGENITLTGDVEGFAIGFVHGGYDPATPLNLYWEKDLLFTGSIANCGSGSVRLYVSGWFDVDDGVGVHVNETISIVPGTASEGLSGVEGFTLFMDDYMDAEMAMRGGLILPVAGAAWCR